MHLLKKTRIREIQNKFRIPANAHLRFRLALKRHLFHSKIYSRQYLHVASGLHSLLPTSRCYEALN